MEPSKIGEVRRVHVIYFLCRNGVVEQPHLIRVHHLHRSGVHLRDVKRWLSELRGKDMPDAYAWSYKRRYKSGHVWQDLTDDDLITPISDNEYVLKGSEVPNINNPLFETFSSGRRTPDCLTHIARAAAAVEEEENPKIDVPSLISSPETLQDDNSSPMPPPHELSEATTPVPSITAPSTTVSPLQRPVPPARQQYSNTRSCFNYSGSTKKASKMLRNLIRCRADDVVHSAVFPTLGCKERSRLTDGDSTGQVSSRTTFDAGSIQPSLTPSSSR